MAETETPKDDAEGPVEPEASPAPQRTPGSPASAAADPTAVPIASAAAVKRTQMFRLELLKKLPKLSYTAWTVKDSFKLDEEWSTVVNLKADALLGPLEPIAPERLH